MTISTPIAVLCGTTGVGKTTAAIALCKAIGGEIVGADSIQVYRGFDIGAAKPTCAELDGVAHHLIDVVEPDEAIDAARYATLADEAIADIRGRGKHAVVVGGTGLWLRALLRGLVSVPNVDPELRKGLENEWDLQGASAMHGRLREVDPRSAARVHPNDKRRVVRALEVHAQTGQALGELWEAHALGAPRYRALTLWLDVPSVHHRPMLQARVARMIERGFADEVRLLVERFGTELRPLHSVGYQQMLDHVIDGTPLEQTAVEIVNATHAYARRQRNWFNADPNVQAPVTPEAIGEPAIQQRIVDHFR